MISRYSFDDGTSDIRIIMKSITGHRVRVGGTQSSGWRPATAEVPLPAPVRDLLFNLEIQFDGFGYLLCVVSEDGELYSDTWYETLTDAELAAAEEFNVTSDQWEDDKSP